MIRRPLKGSLDGEGPRHHIHRMRLASQALDQPQACQVGAERALVAPPLGEIRGCTCVTSSGRQILQHPHEGGRETMLSLGPHRRVLTGRADRTPEEVRSDAEIGLVPVSTRQSHQRLGAAVARRCRSQGLFQQCAGANCVARLEVVRRCNDRPSKRAVTVFRRGQPARELDELGSGRSRSSRAGRNCRLVEGGRSPPAGPAGGESEVAAAPLGVVDDLRESLMKLTTACR